MIKQGWVQDAVRILPLSHFQGQLCPLRQFLNFLFFVGCKDFSLSQAAFHGWCITSPDNISSISHLATCLMAVSSSSAG